MTSFKIGAFGGTLIAFLGNLSSSDLLRTVVLASVGATVSFVLSLILKYLSAKLCSALRKVLFKRKKRKKKAYW